MFTIIPEQASEFAPKVDWLNDVITGLSVFFTVAIVGAMIYFAIRYRKREGEKRDTPRIHGNNTLEIIWTVMPTLICIYIAYYGVVYFHEMRHVPEDAMTVNVTAQKWNWTFDYEGRKSTSNEIVIPVNKPVKFVLTSRDVLHSFFVPAMRVKSDAVPGMYTYVSFKPVKVGDYHVFCTEYCGDLHSQMMAKLKVVSEDEYHRWLNEKEPEVSGVDKGKQIYKKLGCNACHSLDGSAVIGPSFQKLFGRKGTLEGGAEYTADENYIRSSILNPQGQIVQGFTAAKMPVFEGQITDEEIMDVISFIKTLDGTVPVEEEVQVEVAEEVDLSKLTPVERGELIYKNPANLCQTCHSIDGSKVIGPTFKGIFGREEKMADGSQVVADAAYIKESILNPMAQVVDGYPPAMPSFAGKLSDEQIADLTEWLKTVK